MLLERYRISAPPWIVRLSHFVELVFVRFAITCLRLIAPLSILYLVSSLFFLQPLWSPWILIPTVPEAFFFLFIYLPRREWLQRPPEDVPPPLSRDERALLFDRCINNIASFRRKYLYPNGWFIPPDNVHRQNVLEWLLFAFFSAKAPGRNDPPLPLELEFELEGYLKRLELARGEAFPDGRANEAKLMDFTSDRVHMCHRPLLWYFVIGILDHASAFRMLRLGFKHYSPRGVGKVFPPRLFTISSRTSVGGPLSYWYRPPTVQDSENPKPTLIMFHGIGTGIFPYVPFVKDLVKRDPNQGFLFIEILQVSSRMARPIPSRTVLLGGLCAIIDHLELKQLNLVANSYGTLVAAMIIRAQNELNRDPLPNGHGDGHDVDQHRFHQLSRIRNFVLVDMAAFCLHLPDLAQNFIYRQPREAYEWVIWYFSSRDPDVIRTLGRHFFWHDYILWKEDLASSATGPPRHVAVVLGGTDCILPSADIKKYLTGQEDSLDHWVSDDSGLELIYMPEEDHATVFAEGHREALLDIVERYNVH